MRSLRATIRRLMVVLLLGTAYGVSAAPRAGSPFYVDVSPRSGTMEETFLFSVVVQGASDSDFPTLAGGEDFHVALIGPRTSMTVVNGDVRTEVAYSYRLTPRREGLLKTPSAEIMLNGGIVRAGPLEVQVSKNSAPPPAAIDGDISLRQFVDRNLVYEGEQIAHTTELSTAVAMLEPQLPTPSFQGFWSQSMGDASSQQRFIGSRRFTVIAHRHALFPLRSGKRKLAPITLELKVRERRNSRGFPFDSGDPFDDQVFSQLFGNTTFRSQKISSNPLLIEVRPLPAHNDPLSRWGSQATIVGQTSIRMTADAKSMRSGDAKTITVEVTSTGNLNPLKSVPIQLPDTVKTYVENPQVRVVEEAGLLVTTKAFAITIVPLTAGTLTIPPIELSYFDPKKEQYQHAVAPPLSFSVEGESFIGSPLGSGNGTPDSAVATQIASPSALASAEPGPTATAIETPIYREPTAFERLADRVSFGLIALSVLAFLGFLALIRLFIWQRGLHSSLRVLESALDRTEDPAAIRAAFHSFLEHELPSGSPAGTSLRSRIEAMVENPDLRFTLHALLDRLDSMLYSAPTEGRGAQETRVDQLKAALKEAARAL